MQKKLSVVSKLAVGMNFLDTSDVQKKLSVVSKLIVVCELRIDDVTRMSWYAVLTILLLIFFSFFSRLEC